MKVRLVFNSKLLEEREFDRVPCVNEFIWVDVDDLYIVKDVFWLQNGQANILVSDKLA